MWALKWLDHLYGLDKPMAVLPDAVTIQVHCSLLGVLHSQNGWRTNTGVPSEHHQNNSSRLIAKLYEGR